MPPFPGHGLSAGARLRIGRPRGRGPGRTRDIGSATACSCPAPAASATCAACSAAPPPGWSCPAPRVMPRRRTSRRAGRAAGAGRHGLPRARGARRAAPPDLIVGHGVLGRLLARLRARRCAAADRVGDAIPRARDGRRRLRRRRSRPTTRGATTARSTTSAATPRCSTRLIARLAPGGEIVLAGFYSEPLSLRFPPAFMREARIRVAAEWQRADLLAVRELVDSGRLSLDGLITHRATWPRRRRTPTAPRSAIPPA